MGIDEKKKIFIEVKNKADALIHSVEKNIRELNEKISKKEKEEAAGEILKLKNAINTENVEEINLCINSLTKVSVKISQYATNNNNSINSKKNNHSIFRGLVE